MIANFADRLLAAVENKQSHVVVGFDPDVRLLPEDLRARCGVDVPDPPVERTVESHHLFLRSLLQELREEAVAVKFQLACFEALGWRGYRLYEDLVAQARDLGYLVIADAKRSDIGTSAEAYARAHFGRTGVDALTVNPWFGRDGVEPFLRWVNERGRGLFVLVKTSNPGSAEIQDLRLAGGETVYEKVGRLVDLWGDDSIGARGYSSVGAVVGATHPDDLRRLRERLTRTPFLVPGYGAQGGTADDAAAALDAQGTGAIVNSSRGILYAYRSRQGDWAEAAHAEAAEMRAKLWEAAHR